MEKVEFPRMRGEFYLEPGYHYDKEPDLRKRIGEQRFPTRAEALEQHLKSQQPEDSLIEGRDAPYAGEYLEIGIIAFTIGKYPYVMVVRSENGSLMFPMARALPVSGSSGDKTLMFTARRAWNRYGPPDKYRMAFMKNHWEDQLIYGTDRSER